MNEIIMKFGGGILSFGSGLLIGYLLSYLQHGLTKRREADARRRRFRDDIRTLALRFDSVMDMKFIATYTATVPIVRDACIRVYEDVSWWKRNRFNKHRNTYCGFQQKDLGLPRLNTADGLQQWHQANHQKHADMTVVLKSLLERLAQDAK